MQRYFITGTLENSSFNFSNDDVFHMQKVMKMKNGDQIEVVLDKKCYLAKIVDIKNVKIELIEELSFNPELDNEISLYYCLAKGDKIDFVIQKACELGVSKIALIQSKYSVVKFDKKDINKKIERYENIIYGAIRQSHRLVKPKFVGIFDFKDLKGDLIKDKNFIAYEKEIGGTAKTRELFENIASNESVSLLVGPEGGFSEEEVAFANSNGFLNVSLGRRILRSETAAVAILSDLAFILESK